MLTISNRKKKKHKKAIEIINYFERKNTRN